MLLRVNQLSGQKLRPFKALSESLQQYSPGFIEKLASAAPLNLANTPEFSVATSVNFSRNPVTCIRAEYFISLWHQTQVKKTPP